MGIEQLFGGTPEYMTGLLGEQGLAQAQQGANNMGLLGALGQLLAASGPQMRPVSTGQAIGRALMGGVEGYQGAMDKAVQDKITGLKVGQMVQDANEKAAVYKILNDPSARGEDGNFSQDTLRRLATLAPTASKPIFESMKAFKDSQNKVTGQPFAGTDSNGNAIQLQQFDDGTVRTLPGYGPARKMVQQDNGGTITWVDENSVKPGTTTRKTLTPGEQASNALGWANYAKPTIQDGVAYYPNGQYAATPYAKLPQGSQAAAVADLPKLVDNSTSMINNIDELLAHKGLKAAVGFGGEQYSKIPGTQAADFKARLDQIKGGTFMEAYQALKGGGQITEVEGKKAEAALNRMSQSQSEGEFKKAANEFKSYVQQGLNRAMTQAGYKVQQPAQQPQIGGMNMPDLQDQAARVLANRIRNGGN